VCNSFPHDGVWWRRCYSLLPRVGLSPFQSIFNTFSYTHFIFCIFLLLWKLQSRHLCLEFLLWLRLLIAPPSQFCSDSCVLFYWKLQFKHLLWGFLFSISLLVAPPNLIFPLQEVCMFLSHYVTGRSLHCQVENHVQTKKLYFF